MGRTPLMEAPAALTPRISSGGFGRLSFGFLAVSVVSGVALVPFWSSTHALESLERLEGGIPWGFFLRALHAFSSFGLLVATAGHIVQSLVAKTEKQLRPAVWWRSVFLLPLTLMALLGGFVLRGDAEAGAALSIWQRIVESVPVAGTLLARFLLGASQRDLGAVALHHAGTFTLLLWLFSSEHGERLLPDARSTVLAGLVSVALAGAVPLALGAPWGSASPHVLLGPWYLLGLQGALVDLPVAAAWAGPLLLVLLLGAVRHTGERHRRVLLALLASWGAGYAAFTVRLLLLARS